MIIGNDAEHESPRLTSIVQALGGHRENVSSKYVQHLFDKYSRMSHYVRGCPDSSLPDLSM